MRRAAGTDLVRWRGLRWQASLPWIRPRCTSIVHVPSLPSLGPSAKPWALGVPEHTSGAGFWFPTKRSGLGEGPRHPTRRGGGLPTCSKGKTTSLPRRGGHTSLLFGSRRQSLLVPPWPSKLHDGWSRPTSCSGSRSLTTPGLPRQERGLGLRGRGSSASGRRLLRQLQVRFPIGFPHRSFTLLARQSSRPTHVQRVQLAVGTSFRFWLSGSRGPCHHLLRQTWSGALGTGGRAVPQLQRISWWSDIAVAQIEVWAVSKQALSWLDCGRRSSASLDEATTLVAQLEPCEAGLGRTVLGPTTHQKSNESPRSGAATLRTHRRGDHRRPGIAALGAGSARLAGGVRARRSVGGKACLQG